MPYKVNDEYRRNPKSFIPGGIRVMIRFDSGKSLIYDKVKDPEAYMNQALKNREDIMSIWLEIGDQWEKVISKTDTL